MKLQYLLLEQFPSALGIIAINSSNFQQLAAQTSRRFQHVLIVIVGKIYRST
jgi:hypothetical protein